MAELIPLILVLAAVGAFAGLTSGLFGIGGGAVMVPALYFAFSALGVPEDVVMHCSVATSSAVIIINAIRSAGSHHARGAVDMSLIFPLWRGYALWIGLGAFAASVWLAPRLSTDVLVILFAVVAVIVAVQFIFGKPTLTLRQDVPRGAAPPFMGGAVGAVSSLMGIGGGSFSVPLLTFCNVPVHRAIGTAAAFGLFIAVPATLGYVVSGWGLDGRPAFSLGYVNIAGFALITAAAWPFVPLGTALAHRLDAAVLRRLFGIFLLCVAANMARKIGLF